MSSHRGGGPLMVASAGCLTIGDALSKWLTKDYPVGQIIAVRSCGVLLLLATGAMISGPIRSQLVIANYKLHAIRAGLLGLSTVLFVSGLAHMPLTNAVALEFTSPLFVVALAGRALGERVARSSWIAVAAGFAGTVYILNPSIQEFGWVSLLPACAALVSAITDLMTRQMGSRETSLSFVMSGAIGAFVLGLCVAAFDWRAMDAGSWSVITAASVTSLLTNYLLAEAFRRGLASYVAPFRYSAIIWSLAIAFVVWRQTPNPSVVIGSAIVIASGWYLARSRSLAP